MTFFCGFFSRNSSLSFAVLDNVMVDGWSAVYRISIALLRYLESNLLKAKDIGQVSEQINNFRTVQINDLLLLASYEVISPDLDQFRLDYFTKLVGEKLVQDRKEWSRIDQGLLPALEERLKCFVKPIQNEIALRQKRIVQLEPKVNKYLAPYRKTEELYNDSSFKYEKHYNKSKILETTLLELKHQSHTCKQTYKMKQVFVGLREKQFAFNIEQFKKQGLTKDQIVEKLKLVDNLQPKHAFDEQTAGKEIQRLDDDILNVQKRLRFETSMLKIHKDATINLGKRLEQEKIKFEGVATQKAKLMADMQGLLQIVEDDRMRQL